jgi:hypothetical protein
MSLLLVMVEYKEHEPLEEEVWCCRNANARQVELYSHRCRHSSSDLTQWLLIKAPMAKTSGSMVKLTFARA